MRPVVRLALATVLVGAAAGVAGTLLTLLLHLVQHIAFGYTENTFLIGVGHASSTRRVGALFVGGVLCGVGFWLRRRWIHNEAVSVTHALRDPAPSLPVVATFADAAIQIVAVGAGASLGREGAPRQAGAALGGWLATRFGLSPAHRQLLLACGAGAGLAAVYNVPLAGAMFTLEILLGTLAWRAVVPALATSVIATVVAWQVLGTAPTYAVTGAGLDPPVVVWALVLGPVAGVLGVAFSRLMSLCRSNAPSGWHTVVAIPVVFTALGVLATKYAPLLGNGKGMAGLAFDGAVSLGMAATLMVLKPAATAACLASGAIGGLLTPALATGAMLGLFGGHLWSLFWAGSSATQYAVVGAAAFLAITQRAPVTAAVLAIEFIGTGVVLLVPIAIAIVLALPTARTCERALAGWARRRRRQHQKDQTEQHVPVGESELPARKPQDGGRGVLEVEDRERPEDQNDRRPAGSARHEQHGDRDAPDPVVRPRDR